MTGSPIGGFVGVGVGMGASVDDGVAVEYTVTEKVGSTTVGDDVVIVLGKVSVGFGDGCNDCNAVDVIFSPRQAERVSVNSTKKYMYLFMVLPD
jgi:hypothetical protein